MIYKVMPVPLSYVRHASLDDIVRVYAECIRMMILTEP